MKNTIILLFLFCFGYQATAQVAKAKSGTFLLKNATLYTVTDGVKTGDLLIKDGKIAAIGFIMGVLSLIFGWGDLRKPIIAIIAGAVIALADTFTGA